MEPTEDVPQEVAQVAEEASAQAAEVTETPPATAPAPEAEATPAEAATEQEAPAATPAPEAAADNETAATEEPATTPPPTDAMEVEDAPAPSSPAAPAAPAPPQGPTVETLQAEVRELSSRMEELVEEKEGLTTTNIRLSARLCEVAGERDRGSSPARNAEQAALQTSISTLQAELLAARSERAAATATAQLLRDTEIPALRTRLTQAEIIAKAKTDDLTAQQQRQEEQHAEHEASIQTLKNEARAAKVAEVEAQAERDACRSRAEALQVQADSAERTLHAAQDAHRQDRRAFLQSEDTHRLELRSARLQLKSLTGDNYILKCQSNTAREEVAQVTNRLREVQTAHGREEAIRASEQTSIERDREFMRGEIERLKTFVLRLEEGKTDVDILKKIMGSDNVAVNDDALRRLSAAQRLLAEEMGLSMSGAYCSWLDLRERLVIAEEERDRLIEGQNRVIKACEAMAPAIYHQKRELVEREKQLYRYQGLHAAGLKELEHIKQELEKSRKQAQEAASSKAALQTQLNETQKNLKAWAGVEQIQHEDKRDVNVAKVVERNEHLEASLAQLRVKAEAASSSGEHERAVEAAVLHRMKSIRAEHDRLVADHTAISEALTHAHTQRDNVLNLLYTHATHKADTVLTHEVRTLAATYDTSLKATETTVSTEVQLANETMQQKTRQVESLRTELAQRDEKLLRLSGDLDDAGNKVSEVEASLKRQRVANEALQAQLLERFASTKHSDAAGNKHHKDFIALHEEKTALAEKHRALTSELQEVKHAVCRGKAFYWHRRGFLLARERTQWERIA